MDTTNQNAEPSQYLVCIGGWGSTAQIFAPLISECPELQKFQDSQKIELRWQDFVGLPVSARRSAIQNGIQSSMQNALARKVCNQSEISDVLVLAWSLGSMLALELALAQEFQPQKNESMKNAKGKKIRLRLILLSGTAVMCRLNKPESEATENANNDGDYPFVPGAALRAMQRKLSTNPAAVLRNFAQNCCTNTHNVNQRKKPENEKQNSFIPFYLGQAANFLASPNNLQSRDNEETPSESSQALSAGLDYLLRCDLRSELRNSTLPFPVLLAGGLGDAIIPCGQTKELARLLPQGRLALLDAPHNLLMPPAAALKEHIDEFLRR